MIKFENTSVFNFQNALRGARNPLNSWAKADSEYDGNGNLLVLGPNDARMTHNLITAGTEHRKFLRQIFVSVDITAPLYLFKELSTYKIGTTANSCSTMHKIAAKDFALDDFSHEHLFDESRAALEETIKQLNYWRNIYNNGNETFAPKDKAVWWQLIQLLPSSYNQMRTWTGSYENIFNMYHQRRNHKLDEWREGFTAWVESLPWAKEFLMVEKEKEN